MGSGFRVCKMWENYMLKGLYWRLYWGVYGDIGIFGNNGVSARHGNGK